MITSVAQWKILSGFAVYNWKKDDFEVLSRMECNLIKRQKSYHCKFLCVVKFNGRLCAVPFKGTMRWMC